VVLLSQQPSADLVLTNGKIITADDKFTIAQAVAVKGDPLSPLGRIRTSTALRARRPAASI
jgi:predicted amidohydrolase YtcJ